MNAAVINKLDVCSSSVVTCVHPQEAVGAMRAGGAREGRADASLSLVSMATDVLNRGFGGGGLVYWLSYCTPAVSPTKRGCKEFSCIVDPGGLT